MNCPHCKTTLSRSRNYLSDVEWTMKLDCPKCDFGIETESNLVSKQKRRAT